MVLFAGVALAEDPNPALAPELRAEQELERLNAILEQEQAEVKTAEIQLDHFLYAPAGVVRAPEIDAFLAKLEETLTFEALTADLVQATDTLPEAKLPAVWRTI